MALRKFENEAQFRDEWVKPFLSKLGYIIVTHTHGPGEQGKDFFFADFDRFEHLRFFACQVKKGDIGAGDTELCELWNQVERCFTIRLREQKTAEQRHVSAVYVLASGKITDQARQYISEKCHKMPYGENVYFLDGERLEQLERFSAYRFDREYRAKVMGVLLEATSNIESVKMPVLRGVPLQCSHFAMDNYLATAMDQKSDFALKVHAASMWCKGFNCLLASHAFTKEGKEKRAKAIEDYVTQVPAALDELRDAANDLVRDIDAKYNVTVHAEGGSLNE